MEIQFFWCVLEYIRGVASKLYAVFCVLKNLHFFGKSFKFSLWDQTLDHFGGFNFKIQDFK